MQHRDKIILKKICSEIDFLNISDVYYTVKNDFPEFKNKILEILESEN